MSATPADGSLTPSQELDLYLDDRGAWYRYVAPRGARRLAAGGMREIERCWPHWPRARQVLVWEHLPEETRELVRQFRKGLTAEAAP